MMTTLIGWCFAPAKSVKPKLGHPLSKSRNTHLDCGAVNHTEPLNDEVIIVTGEMIEQSRS